MTMAANIKGRKRHLLVDTQGFVLKAKVRPADITDRDGVMLFLESVAERFPRLCNVWRGCCLHWPRERQGLD